MLSNSIADSTASRKLYITTFKFHGMQKRVFFEGDDSEEGERQYRRAAEGLLPIGDAAKSWEEFLPRAIRHFENFGFVWVAH